MGPPLVRLLVEIEPSCEPMQGRVVRGCAWAPFTGWTQLGQAIVRLTDGSQPTRPTAEGNDDEH
jgi:hypothetical protein